MHIPSLIEKKRDGGVLSEDEIREIITAFTSGTMADYQMSALSMAIYFQGMDEAETAALTTAMLESGDTLQHPAGHPPIVDKHSTGGIGDKVSLVLAPLLACDDVHVPMISGRGLGITGGTLDKLESIPGYRVDLSSEEIYATLADVGCVITGQTAGVCPADKKLYALRDVSGTVPSQSLIVASIMSKKLAESLDRLVLDVKFGSGAFMKTRKEAESLAAAMCSVGERVGVETKAVLNPMDEPLGCAVGNALEVQEAVHTLSGEGPQDLVDVVLDLAAEVALADRPQLESWLSDGSALEKFRQMVSAQGGEVDKLETIGDLHRAHYCADVKAEQSGTLCGIDAETVGRALLKIGAGRQFAGDVIDFTVGADQIRKTGIQVTAGDSLMRVHAPSKAALAQAVTEIAGGIAIS